MRARKRKISEAKARKYLRESSKETVALGPQSTTGEDWSVFDSQSLHRERAAIEKANRKLRGNRGKH